MNSTANISNDDRIYTNNIFILSITVTPDLWIIHLGAFFSYIVIAANSIIIPAFLRKEVASPSTLILAGLAFTDEIAAICLFLPKHLGFLSGQLEYGYDYNETIPILSKYPYCRFLFWMDSVLISAFHLISLVLTTLLALQKSVAILFPIRSKRFLKKRTSVVLVLLSITTLLTVYIPYGLMFDFHEENDFCILSYDSWVSERFFQDIFFLATFIYMSSIVLQTICSIYISCKLTCCDSDLQKTVTSQVKHLHRRSAIVVVLIVVIFILSEFLSILCIFQITFTNYDTMCSNQVYDFSDLTLVVGFAANYFVYLVMSRQLRNVLTRHLLCCVPRRKRLLKNSNSTTIKSFSHAMGDRY